MKRVTPIGPLVILLLALFGCAKEAAPSVAPSPVADWPARWEEHMSFNNVTCRIDAEITVKPDYAPEIYTCERAPFDAAQVDAVVDYFAADAIGMAELLRTKRDVLEDMKGLEILMQRGEIDPAEGQVYMDELREELAAAPEETFSAPHDISSLPCTYVFQTRDDRRIYLGANSSGFQVNIGHNHILANGDAFDVPQPSISEQEALEQAACVLKDLQIHLTYANGEPAAIKNSLNETITTGWYLTFSMATQNSLPFDLYGCGSLANNREADYSAPWFAETAFLFIDESGVRQFAWYDKMRVTAQSRADNLLPLAQIQQAFKQYIADCLRWTEEAPIQDLSYDFYQLRLTNVLVPVKNEPQLAAFTPAWVLYGNETADGRTSGPFILCLDAATGKRLNPFTR